MGQIGVNWFLIAYAPPPPLQSQNLVWVAIVYDQAMATLLIQDELKVLIRPSRIHLCQSVVLPSGVAAVVVDQ